MAEDFDWTDRDVVIVPRQDAVAVYRNPAQDIVIRRQRDFSYEDEDPVVVIDRKFAREVAESILRLVEEVELEAAE